MYTLIKTVGRRYDLNGLVDTLDVSQVSLINLSQQYHDICFILNVDVYPEPKVLWFKDLPLDVQVSDKTILQYLDSIGNQTIPINDTIPEYIRGEVHAVDVHSYPFSYQSTQAGAHPNARIEEEDKDDLLLTHEKLSDARYSQHALVSVNGFFHRFVPAENGITIIDGNKTKNKHRDKTHINYLDFSQVGEVKMIQITEEMIKAPNNVELKDNIYIDVNESLVGKTVGIVLGGYLHIHDHTYKQIGDHGIKIDFNNIRWESLFYRMKEYLNIDHFPITDFGNDRVIGFELYHDKTIKALLTMSQSFIVVIDNPYIAIVEEYIGHMGIPKRYESALLPLYPIRIGEGRFPAYKAEKNLDKWVISIEDNIVPLQVRYQREDDDFHMRHDQVYPISGEVYATAHYYRIMTDKRKPVGDVTPLPLLIERSIQDAYYHLPDPYLGIVY